MKTKVLKFPTPLGNNHSCIIEGVGRATLMLVPYPEEELSPVLLLPTRIQRDACVCIKYRQIFTCPREVGWARRGQLFAFLAFYRFALFPHHLHFNPINPDENAKIFIYSRQVFVHCWKCLEVMVVQRKYPETFSNISRHASARHEISVCRRFLPGIVWQHCV